MRDFNKLKEEYDKLINELETHNRTSKELKDRAENIKTYIDNMINHEKCGEIAPGAILKFRNEDGDTIQCRLITCKYKYYDLMIEEGNVYYPNYNVFGYKCRYVDTLIDSICKDYSLNIIDVV